MKIVITGAGNVDAAVANTLVLRDVGREITLVELAHKHAQAEASRSGEMRSKI